MLRRLNIRNFAIIDALDMEFSPHLNIITGETGAGKSILMGALSLILGERADTSYLQDREQKCIVEGYFETGKHAGVLAFLEKEELDISEELIVRREISVAGKSRAFINDTPVTLEQLRTLGELMVDLHRQFDTLDIGKTDFQFSVLDSLAGNQQLLAAYREAYAKWQHTGAELSRLKEAQEKFDRDMDYFQFQYNELEEWNFQPGELENAEAEIRLLSRAEQLKEVMSNACFQLSGAEQPVLQQLRTIAQQLQGFAGIYAPIEEILGRLQSSYIELQDLSDELENIKETISGDPEKLTLLNERLAAGYRLQKKHGVQSTEGLIEIKNNLATKLQEGSDNSLRMEELSQKLKQEEEALRKTGGRLSAERNKVSGPFCKDVNRLLANVGMPNAVLKVAMEPLEPSPSGMDQVEFLFDANKSGRFSPVRKVASGGELSRLMLCIKSLVAGSMDLPTMIFDEIDTGISGEAARQTGLVLRHLADKRQVICITHQPQIAGKADAHYFVYKENRNNKVSTRIRLLQPEERIQAIARMLSGESPTQAALENAREMMRS